jgi:hypothetical protein
MEGNKGDLLISAFGPLASILLAMALVPFRSYTTASNFTYLFLVLTILMAEYGGVKAAIATALCSALSLDFFLTQPYLKLTILDKHDVIAFCGFALCGFLVAGLSSLRATRAAELRSAREQLELLHVAILDFESTEEIDTRLSKLLDAARAACPLAAAAIRDEKNTVLAAFERGTESRRVPVQVLSPFTLLPRGIGEDEPESRNLPFPEEGARVPLFVRDLQVGWLDLWGNGKPVSAGARRTLSDVTSLLPRLLMADK